MLHIVTVGNFLWYWANLSSMHFQLMGDRDCGNNADETDCGMYHDSITSHTVSAYHKAIRM